MDKQIRSQGLTGPYHEPAMESSALLELSRLRSLTRTGRAREIREAAGLSIGEVAASLGVSVPAVWRWERDLRTPRGEAALRYARLLEELRELQAEVPA